MGELNANSFWKAEASLRKISPH